MVLRENREKSRDLLIQKESVCVSRFIQTVQSLLGT